MYTHWPVRLAWFSLENVIWTSWSSHTDVVYANICDESYCIKNNAVSVMQKNYFRDDSTMLDTTMSSCLNIAKNFNKKHRFEKVTVIQVCLPLADTFLNISQGDSLPTA